MHTSLDEFEFRPDPTTEGSKVSLKDGNQAGVCVFVHLGVHSTLSIMNISKTGRPIAIIFYLKDYWGSEKAALGFAADQIRTQDSGDNKTYLTPPPQIRQFLMPSLGPPTFKKRLLFSKLNLGGDCEIAWFP